MSAPLSAKERLSPFVGGLGMASSRDMGVITHDFDEFSKQYRLNDKALCGVQIHDTGLVALGEDGWKPGCKMCIGILRKRGLLPNTQAEQPARAKDTP